MHTTQLLETMLHSFQAGELAYATWRALEAPAMVKAVERRLAGTKTLEEFIAAMQRVIEAEPRR